MVIKFFILRMEYWQVNVNNIKILVVDDSKTFNSIMYTMFKGLNYDVIQAFTLKEAEEKLNSHDINYVMLDLNLPDGNGADIIDNINKESSARIMIMTGDEGIKNRDAIFEKGIIDYFIKTTPVPVIINCAHHLIQTLESHKNINILTIDDSDFIRVILKHILELKGYNVFEASNAVDGKEIIEQNNIHLILLDLIMPGINGMEFLEDIKSNNEYFNIPVIIISGSDSRENYARVLKQGANDFIKKPFIVEEILLKCDIHIKSYLDQQKLIANEKELLKQKTMLELRKRDIQKQNIYHRSLLEASQDPLITISVDGKITDANQATMDVIGISKDELIGSNFCSYFTQPDEAKKVYEKVLKDGKVTDYSLHLKAKNNKNIDVIYNASIYTDENKKVAGVFAAARDVTELNKLRSESEEILKFKTMSVLLDNIAHQWRQPLSVISTGVTGMQMQKEYGLLTDEQFKSTCVTINDNAQYLSNTIDNFGLLFKKDSIKKDIEIEKVINSVIEKYNNYISTNNIKVIKDIDNFNVRLYEDELIQIISSIMNNIKEHAKNNELICINVFKENNTIIIKIKDSGGGVSDEILNNIFEAYFTTKHQYMGKGMGMYIVYQLIREHLKGTIIAHNDTYEYDKKTYTGFEIIIKIPIS